MSNVTVSRAPVLLAKFAVAPTVNWYTPKGDAVRDAFDEALLGLAVDGLIVLGETYGASSFVSLTEAGTALAATARPSMLTTTATDGASRANAALWMWLVVNGSELTSYGDDYPYGRNGQIAHLLLCGLDLNKSGAVKDDTWTDGGSSYDETARESRSVGVSGRGTCICGQVKDVQIKAEVESITALIGQVLASA